MKHKKKTYFANIKFPKKPDTKATGNIIKPFITRDKVKRKVK